MPIDKIPAALKFFNSVIEDHGLNPDEVASALAVFDSMPSMEDVGLRIKAKLINGGPLTALEIYGVDTDAGYRLPRMTNAIEDADRRDLEAAGYMRELSGRIGYRVGHILAPPHGHVGNRQGYAHMGEGYFVAEGDLALPRGDLRVIGLTITMPFADTGRSKKLSAPAGFSKRNFSKSL